MTHWRTARRQSGKNLPPGLHYGAGGTGADSVIPFPPRSTVRAPLELSDVSNSPVHKSTVVIDALCGALTGLGLVVAGIILLFVRLG